MTRSWTVPDWVRLAVMLLGVVLVGAAPGSARAEDEWPVSQVIIVGNSKTPASLIEFLLALTARQRGFACRPPAGRGEAAGTGALDRAEGHVPGCAPDIPGRKVVLVGIRERPWNWLLFAGQELALYRLTGDLARLNHVGLRFRYRIID